MRTADVPLMASATTTDVRDDRLRTNRPVRARHPPRGSAFTATGAMPVPPVAVETCGDPIEPPHELSYDERPDLGPRSSAARPAIIAAQVLGRPSPCSGGRAAASRRGRPARSVPRRRGAARARRGRGHPGHAPAASPARRRRSAPASSGRARRAPARALADRVTVRYSRSSSARASAARVSSSACGNNVRAGEDGHVVRVTLPARHDMQMQVIGEPGARDRPEVQADVEPVRGRDLSQRADRALGEHHQLGQLVGLARLELTHVAVRRDHQVPAGIRERVEHRQAALAAIDDQDLRVVSARRRGTEDAPLRLGALDVLDAPRRPQRPALHAARV